MELKLEQKSVLVTAATYGLGYACAEAFAKENARLIICSRDQNRVDEAVAKLSTLGSGTVIGFRTDITDDGDLMTLIEQAQHAVGNLDILLLNTGHPPTYPLLQTTDEHWRRGIDLVLKPVITLTKAFLPQMQTNKYGRLIYIGSIFGLQPEPSSIIQSTLRTGLNAFVKCVASEAAADGVTANVICPGYFHTPLAVDLAGKYARESGTTTESVIQSWRDLAPSKKFGKPEDLASFVAFLASPHAEFINGTALTIDGGLIKTY